MLRQLAFRHTADLWEVEFDPAKTRDVFERYQARQSHVRDAGFGDGLCFEFNIKVPPITLPEYVYQHNIDSVNEIVEDFMARVLDHFVLDLKAAYTWIDNTAQVGRSGGWLVIKPRDNVTNDSLEEFCTQPTVSLDTSEYAGRVAKDLVDIADLIRRDMAAMIEELESLEFWTERGITATMRQAAETYFDATPSEDTTPEERTFVNPLDDKKLRRTNPKRYDVRHDQYWGYEDRVHDEPIGNRYDTTPALTSSLRVAADVERDLLEQLERLTWEIDNTVDSAVQGRLLKVATQDPHVTFEHVEDEATLRQLFDVQSRAFEKYPVPPSDVASYEAHQSLMKDFDYWKIEVEGQLAGGFIVYRQGAEGSRYQLVRLFVDPSFQGQGIGRKAVEFMESAYPQAKVWTLNTPVAAEDNQRFYEGLGYVERSRQSQTPHPGSVPLVFFEKDMRNQKTSGIAFVAQLLQRASVIDRLKAWRSKPSAHVGDQIEYKDFPQEVQDFVEQQFGEILERWPAAQERLDNLVLEFMVRPKTVPHLPDVPYPEATGAEYFPEENKIGYYLKPDTLSDYWYGIVHELTHVIQTALAGKDSGIPKPPDMYDPAYYTESSTYRQDPGEEQAYAVQEAFRRFEEKGD